MSVFCFPKINGLVGCDAPSREGKKRQQIDANDRAALRDFFAAKDWALNTNLPRGNVYANIKVWPNLGLS